MFYFTHFSCHGLLQQMSLRCVNMGARPDKRHSAVAAFVFCSSVQPHQPARHVCHMSLFQDSITSWQDSARKTS